MAGKSPTQRSLEYLREQGYHPEVVERYNSFTRRTNDLWGFVDILAIKRDEVLGVQTTSGSNVSARIKKIMESELLPKVREANVRIVVHGWTKQANGRYVLRVEDIS
jgi:hypothetical protein